MDVSLFQAAAAMNASSRWQEVIADNLSANQIPGFKKQRLSFSAVQAGFLNQASGHNPGATQRATMPLANASTSFEPGENTPTRVPTDLAISGKGFFQVQLPDGTFAYTRNGGFRVTPQGQLTTGNGLPVMGDGKPIQLDANDTSPMTIAPTGEVSQGGKPKGRLKLYEFANPSELQASATGFFLPGNPSTAPAESKDSKIQQGFLESGNASAMTEMGDLITAMRFYEANQKVIQNEDDRVSHLIAEVTNPST